VYELLAQRWPQAFEEDILEVINVNLNLYGSQMSLRVSFMKLSFYLGGTYYQAYSLVT
jgi:hypothetical protein